MATAAPRFASHEAYLDTLPPAVRERLLTVLQAVAQQVPDTMPCIAYNMPAFQRGRVFAYCAAFKGHIGIYPPVTQDAALLADLAPYRGPKGNLSFVHRDALPLDLIGRVVRALAQQYGRA